MYATVWLDRETFTSIVDYCRALPSFREPEAAEDDQAIEITSSELPNLGEYVTGSASIALDSVSVKFTGSLDACTSIFDLGLSGRMRRTPQVSVEHEGVPVPTDPADTVEVPATADVGVSYMHFRARTLRTGLFVDAHAMLTLRSMSGPPEHKQRVLNALFPIIGLEDGARVDVVGGGEVRLTSLDDRVVVLPPGHDTPDVFLPLLHEGKTALSFDAKRGWLTLYRFESAAELQVRALAVVEALGRGRVTESRAGYGLARADYDVLREATGDLVGDWWVFFTTQGGLSVSDLVDAPEHLSAEMTSLEVGFDVELPVVGETSVGANVEREADGGFRYRLRFYRNYESEEERPDLREERPSETPEGQALLPYLKALEDEALDGVGPSDWVPPAEDLAMAALLRLWGGGRDLIDYDYEE